MTDNPSDSEGSTGESTDDQEWRETDRSLPHDSKTSKVIGEIDATDGIGVLGHNTATSGRSDGVRGVTDSSELNAAGVRGKATAVSGNIYGVWGTTNSSKATAAGVYATTSDARGVYADTRGGDAFFALAKSGRGIFAQSEENDSGVFTTFDGSSSAVEVQNSANNNASSTGYGVNATTEATGVGSAGVFGEAESTSGQTYGVHAINRSDNSDAAAVRAVSTSSARGLYVKTNFIGASVESTQSSAGSFYTDEGSSGLFVRNRATADDGVTRDGILAATESDVAGSAGVLGRASDGSGQTYGVKGENNSTVDGHAGVKGESPGKVSLGSGVEGTTEGTGSSSDETFADGVLGKATVSSDVELNAGVRGTNSSSSGTGYGVYGSTTSTNSSAAGVYASASNGATGISATVSDGEAQGLRVTKTADKATNSDPEQYPALVEHTPDGASNEGLAIRTGYTGTPGSGTNFVTFFDGNDTILGAVEGDGSGGVTTASAGSDYAEYMPRLDPDEEMEAADVVGVVDGQITRDTTGADQAMVVTDQAIVTGNWPGPSPEDRADYETVAFVGQVPVKVRGAVTEGDLVVPSGEADGTARAIAPDEWRPGDGPIVGRAWEGTDGAGLDQVTVAVGLETGAALESAFAQQADRLATLDSENDRLRAELDEKDEQIETLTDEVETLQAEVERLREQNQDLADHVAGLDDRLASLEGETTPASADD